MKLRLPLRVLILPAVALSIGCASFGKNAAASKDAPCVARYVPVGNEPEIALDTQSGQICRTVDDTNDPLGILDAACAVTADMKKVGFVPRACKSGHTWVKGEGSPRPSQYSNLPRCSDVIVVTSEDMKSAK